MSDSRPPVPGKTAEVMLDIATADRSPAGDWLPLQLPSPEATTLQAVLDATPGYALMVDSAHRIVLANQTLAEAVGASVEDLRGQACHERVHGTASAFPGCPLEAALEEGVGVERQLYDEASGAYLSSWVQPTRLVTEDGARIYLHGASDITEDVINERTANARFHASAALAEMLALSVQPSDLRTLARRALETITKLPWLSLRGQGAVFLVDETDGQLRMLTSLNLSQHVRRLCRKVPAGRCHCGRALARGEAQFASNIDERHDVRYPGMQPHGHYCVPIRYDGETLGVLNLYLEPGHTRCADEERLVQAVADGLGGIIQRKLAEQRLSESEARFRTLAEAANDAILLLDHYCDLVFWNPSAAKVFGRTDEELGALLNGTWLFTEESGMALQTAVRDGQAATGTHRLALVGVNPDGEAFPLSTSVSKLEVGGQILTALIMHDKSEQMRLEAALVRSERLAAAGMLAAGVTHEINNPLATLELNLDNLADMAQTLRSGQVDAATVAELQEIAQDLRDAVGHISQVTASMRSLARAAKVHRAPTDLSVVAQRALRLMRAQLRDLHKLDLKLGPVPMVTGNEGQLIQVVINLITNALRAMGDLPRGERRLSLTCRAEEGQVRLEVRDSGPGVPASIRSSLFEPFASTHTGNGGTGLGLWICADILSAHGGTIELDEHVAPGALFVVQLPVS